MTTVVLGILPEAGMVTTYNCIDLRFVPRVENSLRRVQSRRGRVTLRRLMKRTS